MTVDEMSAEFDILYNNIMSNAAPGLNEYEKSVFLTKALSEVLKNYFNPKGNKYQEGFDGNQKRQIDFSSLIRTVTPQILSDAPTIDSRSIVSYLPFNLLAVINESFVDTKGIRYTIVPLAFKDYERLLAKPYAYPPKKILWRLIGAPYSLATTSLTVKMSAAQSMETGPITENWTFTNNYKLPVELNIFQDGSSNADDKIYTIEETNDKVIITVKLDQGETVDTGMPGGKPFEKCAAEEQYKNLTSNSEFTKYITWTRSDKKGFEVSFTPLTMVENKTVFPSGTVTNLVELLGRVNNTGDRDNRYMVRYVKKPNPIILVDLDVDDHTVSIEGQTAVSACELPEEIQPEVVLRAVELAKAAYAGDLNSQIEMGKRSE